MKSINAEDDHRIGFREVTDPFLHPIRIAPDGAVHDVLAAGDVMPGTGIDDLHRRAGVQHGLHFLDGNSRQISELFLHEGMRRLDL